MKVFLDTNVIMEYLCHRTHYLLAKKIMDAAYINLYDACMSSGSFYTLSYLLSRFLKENGVHEPENTRAVRETLKAITEYVGIIDLTHESFMQGIDDLTFKDLEDSYQYYCAIENLCDCILTFNMKDFEGRHDGQMTVLSPSDFVDSLENNG